MKIQLSSKVLTQDVNFSFQGQTYTFNKFHQMRWIYGRGENALFAPCQMFEDSEIFEHIKENNIFNTSNTSTYLEVCDILAHKESLTSITFVHPIDSPYGKAGTGFYDNEPIAVGKGYFFGSVEDWHRFEQKALSNRFPIKDFVEISIEEFEEALNVLPPLRHKCTKGAESFFMSEFYTGSYTRMYVQINGKCLKNIVNIKNYKEEEIFQFLNDFMINAKIDGSTEEQFYLRYNSLYKHWAATTPEATEYFDTYTEASAALFNAK